jgi:hypothetical protein
VSLSTRCPTTACASVRECHPRGKNLESVPAVANNNALTIERHDPLTFDWIPFELRMPNARSDQMWGVSRFMEAWALVGLYGVLGGCVHEINQQVIDTPRALIAGVIDLGTAGEDAISALIKGLDNLARSEGLTMTLSLGLSG